MIRTFAIIVLWFSAAIGLTVGGASAYPAIEISPAGNGKPTARLQIELGAAGDYFVNVHESPEDLGAIVACEEMEPR